MFKFLNNIICYLEKTPCRI